MDILNPIILGLCILSFLSDTTATPNKPNLLDLHLSGLSHGYLSLTLDASGVICTHTLVYFSSSMYLILIVYLLGAFPIYKVRGLTSTTGPNVPGALTYQY